jgi:hypothetical protein
MAETYPSATSSESETSYSSRILLDIQAAHSWRDSRYHFFRYPTTTRALQQEVGTTTSDHDENRHSLAHRNHPPISFSK